MSKQKRARTRSGQNAQGISARAKQRRVAREMVEDVGRVADPFEAERWASWLHGRMWEQRQKVPATRHLDWALVLGAPIAEDIAEIASPSAKACLAALAWADQGPFGALCEKLMTELADVQSPSWAEQIGHVELVRAAADQRPGEGTILLFDLRRRGGDRHSLLVYVDDGLGGVAKHLCLMRSFDQVLVSSEPAAAEDRPLHFMPVELSWACRKARAAIARTDERGGTPIGEGYVQNRAMTLARLAPYLGDGPRVAQLSLGADIRATVPPVAVESPDDLYGLPLERFVEERNALVKALRTRNESEEAKRVNGLRKPTVAAWAVNQLVRTQPKAIKALFDAGDDLASAVAAGRGGAERLRDASKRQRSALGDLIKAAEGLLTGEGRELGSTTLERVSETLRAAALDPQAREEVSGGCLTRELQASGWLGPEVASAPPAAAAEGKKEKRTQQAEQAARKKAEDAVKQLVAAQERRDAVAVEVEQAQAALQKAQADLRPAEDALRKADRALADRKQRADAAAQALKAAEDAG